MVGSSHKRRGRDFRLSAAVLGFACLIALGTQGLPAAAQGGGGGGGGGSSATVPAVAGLDGFVRDGTAAAKLGKALFWDMQAGSDGRTACASCHFSAGADNRSRNQLNPRGGG